MHWWYSLGPGLLRISYVKIHDDWQAFSNMASDWLAQSEAMLTHWGRVTHIYVSKLAIIGSDNGLSPDRRQAIISTNAGILLIRPLGTNFNELLIEIQVFSFKKMHLKMSSQNVCHLVSASTGWETIIFWHLPKLGSLLYSLYKIPFAQACFPLARPNFHSHWRAGER